jgi:hypothetical protein
LKSQPDSVQFSTFPIQEDPSHSPR